ncbi:histone-lysine N-methyltransferase SETMAR [Trichonephila clavipes]|nr:histone-lysine N-methyltransferase SETMAR [Trichonephila clavipes]
MLVEVRSVKIKSDKLSGTQELIYSCQSVQEDKPARYLEFERVTSYPGYRVHLVVSCRVLKMEINKEKVRYILQFFFDKGENASQVGGIINGVYGAGTLTANYVQFWFRRFRSGIFDVKAVPRPSSKMSIKSEK